MRLIDADAIISFVDAGHLRNPMELSWSDKGVVDMIESRPTVDAVPVVRCGECERRYKLLDDDARNEIYCEFIGSTMQKDDFCSYGCADRERRTDEQQT